MSALAIFQLVSAIVGAILGVTGLIISLTKKNPDPAEQEFSSPTADEGKPFGLPVGLTRCKANTISFRLNHTSKVKSDGK